MNHRDVTSYSMTSSDMNMHEHTQACKQAGRWRRSKSVRLEDTHAEAHTDKSLSPYTLTHTKLSSPCIQSYPPPPPPTLIALDIFSFPRRAYAPFPPRRNQRHPRTSRLFGPAVLQFAHVPVAGATMHLAWPAVRHWEKVLRIGLG